MLISWVRFGQHSGGAGVKSIINQGSEGAKRAELRSPVVASHQTTPSPAPAEVQVSTERGADQLGDEGSM